MILGIDASNIRQGGGVTHLVEILRAAAPEAVGFMRVIVWSNSFTLSRIENRPWLEKREIPELNKGLPHRLLWQYGKLERSVREAKCDVLFVPGGSVAGNFTPTVTMSRNMLPFEWQEMRRYGLSLMTLRNLLLRYAQIRSFRKANTVIFLTEYARSVVKSAVPGLRSDSPKISHGIDVRFQIAPRTHIPLSEYTTESPLRILYVSIIDVYKHQWKVVEAVAALRSQGYPVVLDLVGPPSRYAIKKLNRALHNFDPEGGFIRYVGAVDYLSLHQYYRNADINVFASSCENMPNILMEAMAAGLPIACSDRGPMPEILGADGVYFDPEDSVSISRALLQLLISPEKRKELSQNVFNKAQYYSWKRCADETFACLAGVKSSSGEADEP